MYSVIVSTYAFASACASLSTHCDLANSWKTDVLEQIGRSEVDGATYYGGIDASNSLKIESTAYVVLIYAKLNDSGNNFLLLRVEVSFTTAKRVRRIWIDSRHRGCIGGLIDVREAHERSEQLWVALVVLFERSRRPFVHGGCDELRYV